MEQYQGWLSKDERQRCLAFRTEPQRQRYLLSRGLMRAQLAQVLGARPGELTFAQTPEGKPYLAEPHQRLLHFSLSHSGDWVALAAVPGFALGLDLEHPQRARDLMEIARRYFHPLEAQRLGRLTGRAQIHAFYQLWTLKEAFYKTRGTGISEGLDRACFFLRKGRARLVPDPSLNEDTRQWQFYHWHNPVPHSESCYLALALKRAQGSAPHIYHTLPGAYCEPLDQAEATHPRR